MSFFLLEAPARAARRVWLFRPGQVATMIAPPMRLRRRFGDLYGWGLDDEPSHLTAATLLWTTGLGVRHAALWAPRLAKVLERTRHMRIVKVEYDYVATLAAMLADTVGGHTDFVIACTDLDYPGGCDER